MLDRCCIFIFLCGIYMYSDTESSDSSIVLSNRHLKTEEVFEFSVESVTNSRPNSFKFGVTTKTPAEIGE